MLKLACFQSSNRYISHIYSKRQRLWTAMVLNFSWKLDSWGSQIFWGSRMTICRILSKVLRWNWSKILSRPRLSSPAGSVRRSRSTWHRRLQRCSACSKPKVAKFKAAQIGNGSTCIFRSVRFLIFCITIASQSKSFSSDACSKLGTLRP